jgi:hypothetical protein
MDKQSRRARFSVQTQDDYWSFSLFIMVPVSVGVILVLMAYFIFLYVR